MVFEGVSDGCTWSGIVFGLVTGHSCGLGFLCQLCLFCASSALMVEAVAIRSLMLYVGLMEKDSANWKSALTDCLVLVSSGFAVYGVR